MERLEGRSTRAGLFALATLVAVTAACSAGGDSGSDTKPSCQILWASLGAGQGLYDVYLVEMSEEKWVDGGTRELSYEDGVFGMFYDEFDDVTGDYQMRGVATAGAFSLTSSLSAPPAPGDPVGFKDLVGQAYFNLDDEGVLGAVIASGGAGTFAGEWSPETGTVVPGAGTTLMAVAGTSLELGTFVRYAQCYRPGSSGSSSTGSGISARGRWPVPRFPHP